MYGVSNMSDKYPQNTGTHPPNVEEISIPRSVDPIAPGNMDNDISKRHTEEITERFPEPLCYLLIDLAERNREHLFNGEKWRRGTIGYENVRECGLTAFQIGLAEETADLMETTND